MHFWYKRMLTALKEPLLILISLSSIKPDQTAGSETIKMILLFHLRMMLARHSLSHQTGSVGPVNQILTHNKLVADRSFYFSAFLFGSAYLFILPSTPLGHGTLMKKIFLPIMRQYGQPYFGLFNFAQIKRKWRFYFPRRLVAFTFFGVAGKRAT